MEYYLQHHGIKGMKWGVRRTEAQLNRVRTLKNENDKLIADTRKSVTSLKRDVADIEKRGVNSKRVDLKTPYNDIIEVADFDTRVNTGRGVSNAYKSMVKKSISKEEIGWERKL